MAFDNNEKRILASWHKNVAPWAKAIADGEIESRVNITNQAIIDVVKSLNGHRVLDVGCGCRCSCRVSC